MENRKEQLQKIKNFCHEVLGSRDPRDEKYEHLAREILRAIAKYENK